jgi:hypothetical protein
MTFLSDYLEKRRSEQHEEAAQRELDESSPEKVLESLRANTSDTADLIGKQSSDARAQNKSVLDSLDVLTDTVEAFKVPDNAPALEVSFDQAADAEQRATKVTNSTLIEINKQLKDLVTANEKVEKYLRPELNSKDDTYAKRKDDAQAVKVRKSLRVP